VGDVSLHREWIGDPARRSYDVWLDYWGPDDARWSGEPARVTVGRDTVKYPRLATLLPELLPYDAIWLPDDDISVDPAGVERLFEIFHRRRLLLAQPALTDASYFAHEVTLRSAGFEVRFTNFAEAMAPVFSRDALRACAETFASGASGWGIDFVWSAILGEPRDGIAVIDAAPVTHTRPIGKSAVYAGLAARHTDDRERATGRYGVQLPFRFRQYGGISAAGRRVAAGPALFARMAAGAPPSQRLRRRYHSRMLRSVLAGLLR
jgi:hypothetical protein